MNAEQASRIILNPHITEKTFGMAEEQSRICFIVARSATKPQIAEAVKTLYNQEAVGVNTARTVYGKKAFVTFRNAEKAKDLASEIGML